ncbi:unnamed protein product, partial [Ectocarpus sp. 6 AP-2014]
MNIMPLAAAKLTLRFNFSEINYYFTRQKSEQHRNNRELVNYKKARVGNEIKSVHRASRDNAT